jgi:hypothetical protein
VTVTDLAEFLAAQARERGPCRVGRALEDLEAERRAKLAAALARPDITTTAISRVLASWGHEVSFATISRHRKGECACQRT